MKTPVSLYPIVVIEDRYGGCYSDGQWLAIAEGDKRMPEFGGISRTYYCLDDGPNGSDTDAMEFWANPPSWVAIGISPDLAVKALLEKHGAPA